MSTRTEIAAKRNQAGRLMAAEPGLSDREVGRIAGLDHKTVATVRRSQPMQAKRLFAEAMAGVDAALAGLAVFAERGDELAASGVSLSEGQRQAVHQAGRALVEANARFAETAACLAAAKVSPLAWGPGDDAAFERLISS